MNLFRIIADASHITAMVIILAKLIYTRSGLGISGRSQLLFAIVYTARYADLWLDHVFYSYYNSIVKIAFIVDAFIVVFLIFVALRKTYQQEKDVFLTELLLFPSFILAMTHDTTSITEMLWAFSIYLEAVAILPQFHMILKSKEIERVILYYLIALGLYRTMYIVNWVYRYFAEDYFDSTAFSAGIIYALIYAVSIPILIANGVKITVEGKKAYLRRNIFFISSNEPLDTSTLIHDSITAKKNGMVESDIQNV